ncbi:expressed unknown protein [Seminavis robusta]|uniref:Uncharacterized protein n=1 Tax=Seminavis robusta TaxID=568900 RepID=A0A9N8HA04_9STRA|nr:expressed unknown protein [Seminavis robusta]|eukprot:Sro209_g087360.1 n/a (337) ;mRNA; f:51781-52791
MKLADGLWTIGLLLVLAIAPADGGFLDFFFGREEAEIEPIQGAGLFLDNTEFELGKRGFDCLQAMAGVDDGGNDWGQLLIRPIARVMLNAYGEAGINQLCRSPLLARMQRQNANRELRRKRRRELASSLDNGSLRSRSSFGHPITKNGNDTTINSSRRRDQQESEETRSCGMRSAPYPGGERDADETYDEFATSHLDDYLNSRNERTDPVKTFDLHNDLNVVRMAGTLLSQCSLIWSGVNQLLAVPDVPIVNQAAISEAIQKFVCDLPNTYNRVVQLRLQRDQELLAWHNKLVESAEVKAMYENTNTLASELCVREETLKTVLSDIEALKDTVNRM